MSNLLLRLAATLCLLALHGYAPAQSDLSDLITWRSTFYNPKPAEGDLILPMPCGGAMAFRPVEIPSESWLDDRRVELGHADQERGYKEGRRFDYIAGAFASKDDAGKRLYYLGKYETTVDQYAVLGASCSKPSTKGRRPITDVSWFDAVQFARAYTEWLLQRAPEVLPGEADEPGFLRLPTEVEWEFAARGGLRVDEASFVAPVFPMPGGSLAQYAWYGSTQSAAGRLHPAGLLMPNPLGLHDILGNASEMVFVPFQLDHRGRLHGQTGGFVVRGGDIFTPPSQLRTAVRQEHSYFDRDTNQAKYLDTVGFRLVLAAPVIVSKQRLQKIKQDWAVLPTLVGDVGEDAEKALRELHDIALKTRNAELRGKLEIVQRDFERAHARINDARNRTVRGFIHMGAFLAKRVSTDQVRLDGIGRVMSLGQQRFDQLQSRAGSGPQAQPLIAEARRDLDSKLAKWRNSVATVQSSLDNSLSYYGDVVLNVARDYAAGEMERQLKVVRTELTARDNEYLIPYAELFTGHVREYRDENRADKTAWLEEISDLGSGD